MVKKMEKSLDSELWHACAGGMVKMPPVNSEVFYFPQGHAEHASSSSSVVHFPRIPPLILCHVTSVKFLADPKTDEVYAKIGLTPDFSGIEFDQGDMFQGNVERQPPVSFVKTLTQSDANNGGGFSVPRYCADTIFPPLDYTADPPVQNIVAKDVHGEMWKFRHIYRGTPRRHLLTTGWSAFVNRKQLMAGDSIVFLRAVSGDLCIGVRRMKHSGWSGLPDSHVSAFMREGKVKISNYRNGNGDCGERVNAELVVEASIKAANGEAFEVVYHPRTSTPEFCVLAKTVRRAMEVRWCPGMRFKMAFETEDSSRISWFMGTVSAVQPVDTIRWPDSPWRLLEVAWDEPEMLQNVKRVSPWLVEPVSSIHALNLSPFSPQFKRPRLFQPQDLSINTNEFPVPRFPTNFLFGSRNFLSGNHNHNNTVPSSMQGARHTQFDLPLIPFSNPKLLLPTTPNSATHTSDKSVSCLRTKMDSIKNKEKSKTPQFVLFGRPILTEQEISLSLEKTSNHCSFNLETTNHCKVYMESEDVGRTLDLSVLGSYDALRKKLGQMFKFEHPVMLNNVIYCDGTGEFKSITNYEPFSEFARTARRLKIQMDLTTSKP